MNAAASRHIAGWTAVQGLSAHKALPQRHVERVLGKESIKSFSKLVYRLTAPSCKTSYKYIQHVCVLVRAIVQRLRKPASFGRAVDQSERIRVTCGNPRSLSVGLHCTRASDLQSLSGWRAVVRLRRGRSDVARFGTSFKPPKMTS